MKPVLIAAVYFIIINKAKSQLFPIDSDKNENIFDTLISTKRDSLDDCATRYYRYGRDNLASPVLGTPVKPSEFAHFAAIGWTRDGKVDWDCGGSLISDNFVMSAGHCSVSREGDAPDKALLGDRNPYSTVDDEFAQLFDIVQTIRHEEYRSSLRYYDIALFKLNKNIRPHKTVIPACLWSSDNYLDFKDLEAIGIGQTGFYENKTDRLEKVTLNPMDLDTCKTYYDPASDRKIRNGLVEHQICARDNKREDLRQDTCLGDSGGPLQIKLLANGRITPFIVGVTSFGKACGFDAPGVYSSVHFFRKWIEEKVGISFEPRKCALRYVSLREFQPGLLELSDRASDSDNGLSLEDYRSNWINSKIHIARDYRHKAYIGTYKGDYIHWFCGASLVSEKYLLTAAHCLGKRPDVASVGGLRPNSHAEDHLNQKREIDQIIVHPSYKSNEIHNDIALIKLKEEVDLSLDVVPACIWKKKELPTDTYEVVGWGSRTSNLFFIDLPVWEVGNDEVFPIVTSECDAECQVTKTKPLENVVHHSTKDEVRYLEVNSTILSNQQCNEFYRKKNGNRILDSQICIQNDLFAVPGICELDVGGPVERKVWAYNEYDSYIFGVNSFGSNCGFGTPVVATRVSSFADWIEETVLGVKPSQANPTTRAAQQGSSDQIIFVDTDLATEGNLCTIPGDSQKGICKEANNCPGLIESYRKKNQQVKFCSFSPKTTVCCPSKVQTSAAMTNGNILSQCSSVNRELRQSGTGASGVLRYENNKIFTHMAAIGFTKANRVDYRCWGALITADFVVTTASCLSQSRTPPKQVRLGNINFGLSNEEQLKAILKVVIHPLYRANSYYNDIALLKLVSPARLSRNVIPACLWESEDKIPFIGIVPGPSTTSDIAYKCDRQSKKCEAANKIDAERKLLTLQQDTCQKYYKQSPELPEGVIASQFCAQAEKINSTDTCVRTPGALYQKGVEENGVLVPYVVGLYSYDKNCHRDNPAIFTRISSFINFITETIYLS